MAIRNSVRLAIIGPNPSNASDMFRLKGTPVADVNSVNAPMGEVIRTDMQGRMAQATTEIINAMVLAAPQASCGLNPPAAPSKWCVEPLQKRRALLIGSILQPLPWVSTTGNNLNTPDVGTIMPDAITSVVQPAGRVRFNDTGVLLNCPLPPTIDSAAGKSIKLQELEAIARSLGIEL